MFGRLWQGARSDGLRRPTRVEPRLPSADQRARLRPAGSPELERHTGARGFVVSGAVDGDRRLARHSARPGVHHRIEGIEPNGAGNLAAGGEVDIVLSRI